MSTSIDDLYNALIAVVGASTGRMCWRKTGIQAQPQGAYATVQLTEGPSPTQDIVERVSLTEGFSERPWGTTHLDVKVEFFRNSKTNSDTALNAAIRFRNALQLEERFQDLWLVCGLTGPIHLVDVSTMFRADVEGRAEIRFSAYTNLSAPLPLPDTDIGQIDHQTIGVYRTDTTDKITDLLVDNPS